MSANLTPEYDKAEQRFREATTDAEKLEGLRGMLRAVPKHKGTEKMQADLKRRISVFSKASQKKGAKRGPDPFHVPKGGAGQVVLIGAPNAGKSMLVSATTNATVKVAEYPYTTAVPVPGMWPYEDVQIELVDTPPLTAEHVPPGLMGTIRAADIVAVVVDAAEALEQSDMVLTELEQRGVTLRTSPISEFGEEPGGQMPGLVVVNKIDLCPAEDVAAFGELFTGEQKVLPVSAASGEGLDRLLAELWRLLALIRVYTKQPGKAPSMDKPFALPVGSTVEDLARGIHRELPETMKFARIWGDGHFAGQQVHRTEALRDRDVVEIHE